MAPSGQRGRVRITVLVTANEPKSIAKPPSPFRYFNSSSEVIRLVVMMYVKSPLSLRKVLSDQRGTSRSEVIAAQDEPQIQSQSAESVPLF